MDPLTWILREIAEGIAGISDAAASLILRALLFFGVTTSLTGLAFENGSRSLFVQTMAFTTGILLATFFPLERLIPTHPTIRASLLTLALVALAFLPARLPFYLTPNTLRQKRIRTVSYALLIGLFLLAALL